MSYEETDILIVGGGLVGLSTAMHIIKMRPRSKITVIEKDSKLAAQQSGHNSDVLHAGIYYEPGSLKAKFCVEGSRALGNLCDRLGMPIIRCGKVVVANTEDEKDRLERLHDRAVDNGVPGLRLLSQRELRDIEPNVEGLKALHVPSSAIVDYKKVAAVYAAIFEKAGGQVLLDTEFISARIENGQQRAIVTHGGINAKLVINCAGLHSDVVAKRMGHAPDVQIIPFRGEYYLLQEESRSLVNGLVYPVPDPGLPFLGAHFTPRVSGEVEVGPSAMLATKREGYSRTDFSYTDFRDTLNFPGFWKLVSKNLKPGMSEIHRAISKKAFVKSLQRLVPDITAGDLVPGGAGVRAMAVDRNGNFSDDFYIEEAPGAIHVLNAPSPAATSSFMIGKYIANKADLRISAD
ncbi:MAG: L-2-hydroxyglutarate oxidase [Gammaproteobacteria bacterium]|jgi:L-2-hydroxyglutarate oxidase LhgO|nr:L-2-hydroxyglutarate oxidase [Gammaproteobacteria bacterium]